MRRRPDVTAWEEWLFSPERPASKRMERSSVGPLGATFAATKASDVDYSFRHLVATPELCDRLDEIMVNATDTATILDITPAALSKRMKKSRTRRDDEGRTPRPRFKDGRQWKFSLRDIIEHLGVRQAETQGRFIQVRLKTVPRVWKLVNELKGAFVERKADARDST